MRGFDHGEIERRAQEKWHERNLHTVDLQDSSKEPYYLLFEFPYPSGDLHVGHWYAFALTDIFARMKRMQGNNVLFPIGFDAFGLPAENAAIKHGVDPREWTYANMERMREQIRSMGTSLDWSKEVVTCSPEFYKWTQWLFLKFLEHGLAERREAPVKWCPKDATVLANEQVHDGKCERCGSEVEEKRLTQWFLKITNYAERLIADLDPLPWREEIKEAQRAWIGKSEGAKLYFPIEGTEERIEVFTTRPDTVFGATYVVLAPEHPLLMRLGAQIKNREAVTAYQQQAARKTERERSENKEKTGICLEGVRAINPATNETIPVYLADYVLASYGTGAVMAVPAHDERDHEFATKMGLPITYVIDPITGEEQENPVEKEKIVALVTRDDGMVLTIKWPPELGGRLLVGGTANPEEAPSVTASREILEETGYADLELVHEAEERVHHSYFAFSKNQATLAHTTLLHFKLRSETMVPTALEEDEIGKFEVEWVSPEVAVREIHDDQHQRALARFVGNPCYTGDGLLTRSGAFTGRHNREAMWDIVAAIGGERTTNYRLRDWLVSRQRYWGCPIPVVYDPDGTPHPVPAEHLPWLLPTDVSFDAAESGKSPLATSKELKERVTAIFGEGWTPEYDTLDTFVDSSWYFYRYLDPKNEHEFSHQGLMKKWLPVDRYSGGSEHTTMHLLYSRFFHKALYDLALVPNVEPFNERMNRGLILGPDGQKMSKSKGNVVNPDEFVKRYGADAVRIYLAFIGPYNEPGNYPWKLDGVESMRRFLERITWIAEKVDDSAPTEELARSVMAAVKKVGENTERFKYNTAISALMVALKELEAVPAVSRTLYHDYLRLLAPYAPHLAEHLFEITQGEGSIHATPWPTLNEELLATDTVSVVVQVSGKRKGEVTVAPDAPEEAVMAAARALSAVETALSGQEVKRVVYVPGRILNIVI